jgi:hypothetical protein
LGIVTLSRHHSLEGKLELRFMARNSASGSAVDVFALDCYAPYEVINVFETTVPGIVDSVALIALFVITLVVILLMLSR